jgi:sigma-B regulation protein RsbU (phosphoserine phosphatase)
MTRLTYYRLSNAMLFSILVSNAIGVTIVRFFTQRSAAELSPGIARLAAQVDQYFLPVSFILPLVLILIYERPIRGYLRRRHGQEPVSEALVLQARRRLLNEPFFLIGLSFCMWMASAMIYPAAFWAYGAGPAVVRTAFWRSLYTGLITVTVAFFVLEFILQRRVAPFFFPDGGLSMIPRTLRIRIRTRLTAFLLASNIVPLMSIWQNIHGRSSIDESLLKALGPFHSNLVIEVVVFMAVGIWLTFLVSSNLTKPLKEIIQVLRRVQNGLFDAKVRVTSNDEIGYTGDVINAMTEGLIERDRIKQSLALAQEIQQNLFPRETLKFEGFEVAGRSVYCDETGGDYFDFIPMVGGDRHKLGVAIGDVSGHGISSALLMATVRSSLRQRASHPGAAAQIISDVNRQLAQDVERSGEFVTLFFLVMDTAGEEIAWVRAGHEPAIVYDPGADSFEEIGGPGMALGVDESCVYSEHVRTGLPKGRVILLGTDGVWEASNQRGEMFGKARVYDTIRRHHHRSASEILEAVLDAQASFQGGARKVDDATLVMIKIHS